ncbi:ISOAMYL ACETATE-HYDROLYZING ESTERASE 1 [Salix purpurea]|uniref:ISOAMYL ACETATE-HYDROLYZING ESTERASE 1 n=1 Tax=Salix purpurea TaxID=77065 RepID=A0A9Q0VVG6_SALPP|nr:ISOAMYL ACETATE-HYDROLYZING ESTERASE 1 [Salix purpurea]
MQQKDDWLTTCFTDGVHLASEGSKIVANEIMRVLEVAEWEPSLHWKVLPSEFVGISPFDSEGNEAIVNAST